MLSRQFTHLLSKLIENAVRLKCIPYKFDRSALELRTRKSNFLYYFVNVNALIQTVIIIVQYFVSKKNQSINSSFMHLFRIICNTTGAVLQLQTVIFPDDLKLFVNSLLYYNKSFSETYVVIREPKRGFRLDALLKILYNFAFLYSILVPLSIFRNPTSPRYLYSLFYRLNQRRVFIPIFVLLDLVYALFTWHIILFNIYVFLAYVFSNIVILEAALSKNIQHVDGMEGKRASSSEMFRIYRSMQVLNNELLVVMSPVSLPSVKLACIAIPITLNFMSIRLHDAVPVAAYVVILVFSSIGMIFTLSCWPTAANVNSLSMKLIKNCSVSKREKRSLWALRVRFGCFNLTRFTSIKVFGFVVYWTMKILLLFKG